MRKIKPGTIRTTFDFAAEAAHLADAIAKDANLPSRREAVEKTIRFYAQVVAAQKQGCRVMMVTPDGQQSEMPLDLPAVQPQPPERLIVTRINDSDVTRLLAFANRPYHPAATVILRLAMAASHPGGPQLFPASLLFQYIYWALRLEDREFLELARDVVTTCVTACDSFAHLLSLEGNIPSFDGNFVEQQFLSDEYHAAKRRLLSQ